MDVKTVDANAVFRAGFTRCKDDTQTLILDIRNKKEFAKQHVALAYNIRLTAKGDTLLDYSKNTYDQAWSQDCWWNKPVIVYGDEKLRKDHPVVAFLAKENRCASLGVFKEGFQALQKKLPFICTASTKANCAKHYPSEILAGLLYLGDWASAEAIERFSDLNIRRVISIHNNPENLQLPAKYLRLQFSLADVDTQDISPFFAPSYDFIEEARAAGQAVLVHCGAGVSRSAALVIAYLMRRFAWNAAKARRHCHERRSLVNPNDGFWRSLCALEGQLGILERSNADAGGGRGMDAGDVRLAEGAAGEKVQASFVSAKRLAVAAKEAPSAQQADADGGRHSRSNGHAEVRDDRHRHRPTGSRDREQRSDRRDDDERRDRRSGDSRRDRHTERETRERRDHHERREQDGEGHEDRRRDGDRVEDGRDAKRRRHNSPHEARNGRGSGHRRHGLDGEQPEADAGAAPLPEKPADESPGVVFEVTKEGLAVGQLALSLRTATQRCLVGRHPDCAVHLEHLSISRHHAELTLDHTGNLFLTDLGAAHRTNVNSAWIRPNAPRQLQVGDVVRFGASTRQYKVLSIPSSREDKKAG